MCLSIQRYQWLCSAQPGWQTNPQVGCQSLAVFPGADGGYNLQQVILVCSLKCLLGAEAWAVMTMNDMPQVPARLPRRVLDPRWYLPVTYWCRWLQGSVRPDKLWQPRQAVHGLGLR